MIVLPIYPLFHLFSFFCVRVVFKQCNTKIFEPMTYFCVSNFCILLVCPCLRVCVFACLCACSFCLCFSVCMYVCMFVFACLYPGQMFVSMCVHAPVLCFCFGCLYPGQMFVDICVCMHNLHPVDSCCLRQCSTNLPQRKKCCRFQKGSYHTSYRETTTNNCKQVLQISKRWFSPFSPQHWETSTKKSTRGGSPISPHTSLSPGKNVL